MTIITIEIILHHLRRTLDKVVLCLEWICQVSSGVGTNQLLYSTFREANPKHLAECLASPSCFKKAFWHFGHWKIFSLTCAQFPVASQCPFSLALVSKALPHCWHWYFFRPLWTKSTWSLRVEFCQNFFPHWGQVYLSWDAAGMVTNSILFGWLFTIKDRCQKFAFTNTKSRFGPEFFDGVLWSPSLFWNT